MLDGSVLEQMFGQSIKAPNLKAGTIDCSLHILIVYHSASTSEVLLNPN